MFANEEDLPEDVESLKALVLDMSRRLQNAQHTIEAERLTATHAVQQADFYRCRLTETQSAFRVEAARIRNTDMKYRREKDARKYEENKAKNTALVEELRIAELDAQMAGMTRTVPIKLSRLRAKVSALEAEQQSLRVMLAQLAEIENMNEKLVVAAQQGSVRDSVMLLQSGADINYIDGAGHLALHYSCKEGHADAVNLLLDQGSDYNARLTGHCPLVMAARSGKRDIVQILLDHGANVEEKGVAGYPAIISALMHNRISTMKFLLEQAKADINATDGEENTALHHAVRSDSPDAPEIVKYLMDMGINTEKFNRDGLTALQAARYAKKKAVVEVLTGIKADEDEEGTPNRRQSPNGRKSSMMVIGPTQRPPRGAVAAARANTHKKPPLNAIPKHKRGEVMLTPQSKTKKATVPFGNSPLLLAKGSELDGIGEEAMKDESSSSQILSAEGLNLLQSMSIASSVTFDP